MNKGLKDRLPGNKPKTRERECGTPAVAAVVVVAMLSDSSSGEHGSADDE
jgi:hypothetical protein